jgi:G3E family GTPase
MSIPLHLVTGFLGSGKTSFLKHYLNAFGQLRKIAIVQNEFSPVNIDGRELTSNTPYRLLEVNNGSAFCVCLLGSFIPSLAAFIDEVQPDEILMEASGLSDPIDVGQIFQSPQLKGRVYLDHLWCVVDAQNFDRLTALRFRMEHQLQIADTIVVNKTDLAGEKIHSLLETIKKLNPFAQVLCSSFAQIDLNTVKKAPIFLPVGEQSSAGRPSLDSQVVKTTRKITPTALKAFISNLREKCVRCKGFVNLRGENTLFVQGVFEDYKMTEVNPTTRPTELILIGNFNPGTNYQSVFEEYCQQ